jgi:uncharacterized DUF497 family protein
MKVEFDEAKNAGNLRKHRLSLSFGAKVFDDPELLVLPTIRDADEEERYKAIGLVEGKLYTAVHVWRGDIVRSLGAKEQPE